MMSLPEWCRYKEVLTVLDVLANGACISGVVQWVVQRGRMIKERTDELYLHLAPGERVYVFDAARSAGPACTKPSGLDKEAPYFDVKYGRRMLLDPFDGYGYGSDRVCAYGQAEVGYGVVDGRSHFMTTETRHWMIRRRSSSPYGYSYGD